MSIIPPTMFTYFLSINGLVFFTENISVWLIEKSQMLITATCTEASVR